MQDTKNKLLRHLCLSIRDELKNYWTDFYTAFTYTWSGSWQRFW